MSVGVGGIAGSWGILDTTATLVTGIPATEREFMVYLPLRNGVTSIGICAFLRGPPSIAGAGSAGLPRSTSRSYFAGTSITHGNGASRARMTHVAMLGRTFRREVINIGFSGNGRMEPEVVKFVAELDPAVFVLDCLPNMNAQQVTERIVPQREIAAVRLPPQYADLCWWRIATYRLDFPVK